MNYLKQACPSSLLVFEVLPDCGRGGKPAGKVVVSVVSTKEQAREVEESRAVFQVSTPILFMPQDATRRDMVADDDTEPN